MNDVYAAPSSDLTNDNVDNIFVFERFSTWFVIGLTIITLSVYIVYWLYTRTVKLNSVVENQISTFFINFVLIFYIATLVFTIGVEFVEVNKTVGLISSLADFMSNILVLVWVFKFKSRVSQMVLNDPIKLSPVITFFFQVFYLQYKLNEIIDYRNSSLQP